MGTVRRVCRNVKRWRSASMAMRWTAAAMQEAAKGFRRLKAYKQLPCYVLLSKLTKTKTHVAFLLAKPTPRNLILGTDRFSMFNKRRDLARLRTFVFDKAISAAVELYIQAYDAIMEGKYDRNLFDLLDPKDPRLRLVYGAKEFARQRVFNDTKKIEMEIGCYAFANLFFLR